MNSTKFNKILTKIEYFVAWALLNEIEQEEDLMVEAIANEIDDNNI
ncbi:MAG: hypothetical protein PUP93_20535 [Rhizonema sp. NSF051]|nr:hypothetical protein [Rhizonema sp. NSF051]